MPIPFDNKDSFDKETTTANKQLGFDLSTINLVILLLYLYDIVREGLKKNRGDFPLNGGQ